MVNPSPPIIEMIEACIVIAVVEQNLSKTERG
jgi:hypothetical protein